MGESGDDLQSNNLFDGFCTLSGVNEWSNCMEGGEFSHIFQFWIFRPKNCASSNGPYILMGRMVCKRHP